MAGRLSPGRRLVAAGATLAAAAGAALGLGGCASHDAQGLINQACQHIGQSIALYRRSAQAPPLVSLHDQVEALTQLQLAQPLAATAAGEDATWQALMTTLSESPRIPEYELLPALQRECAPGAGAGAGAG
jgi:hypothetical protein